MKAQKAQSKIIKSLYEKKKDFHKIKTVRRGQRQIERNICQSTHKYSYNYCGSIYPSRQCPVYGKKCAECVKTHHFKEACRSVRRRTVHNVEQESDKYQEEDHIDMVNINSINFKSKHSVITANLKTSSHQVRIIVPYKVDTGNDRDIMPLCVYKNYFLGQQKNNWQQQEIKTSN